MEETPNTAFLPSSMGSIDFVELLKNRSSLFHEYARGALARGHRGMAVLHAEQALQLRLEALALRMLGHIPRIHGVRELLGIVVESLDALIRGTSPLSWRS